MIQAKLFLMFLCYGLILGCVWGLLNFLKLILKNNVVVNHILEIPFAVMFVLGFFVMLILKNYGEFRFYLFIAWCLGMFLERKTVGKLFAKLYFWLYNKFSKWLYLLKQIKLFKRVLK